MTLRNGSDPLLARENARRFQFPVTCFTFGGKLERTAKSRQHDVQVAIVFLLECTKRNSAFNDYPQFSWSDLTDKEEIGSGCFWVFVYCEKR